MGLFPVQISFGATHSLAVATGRDLAGHVFAAVEDKGRLSLLLRNEGPASLTVRSIEDAEQAKAELILQMSYQDTLFVLASGSPADIERLYRKIARKILWGVQSGGGSLRNQLQSFVFFLVGGMAALALSLSLYVFGLLLPSSSQIASLVWGNHGQRSEVQLEQSGGRQVANGSPVVGGDSMYARAERIRDDILRGDQISEARLATLPESVQAAARAAISLRDAQRAAALAQPPSAQPSPTGAPLVATEQPDLRGNSGAGGAVFFVPTDRHGVATIPNSGSPLYRTPRPRLPMPGGGDVTAPEHLQIFGLSPY